MCITVVFICAPWWQPLEAQPFTILLLKTHHRKTSICSQDVRFTIGRIVHGRTSQDWSVTRRSTWSLNLFTLPREPGMLHCSPPTSLPHTCFLCLSLSFSVPFLCNLCGPSCPQSRKSLSVGEATVQWWFSLREHSFPEQAWPLLHTD